MNAEVLKSVTAVAKPKLAAFELPKALGLLAEPWTPDNDMARARATTTHLSPSRQLTPAHGTTRAQTTAAMKLKRANIVAANKALLTKIYA